LVAILHTHHHSDHIGGTAELLRRWPQAAVIASADDRQRIPLQTCGVAGGERFSLLGRPVHVLAVPGHTRHHIAFYLPPWGKAGDDGDQGPPGDPRDATPQLIAPEPAAPAAAGAAKPSPLDMIRKQQAAKAAAAAAPVETASTAPAAVAPTEVVAPQTAPAAAPPVVAPKPIPTTGPDGKPLSKLDQIRMQGAAKK
ncbi:MAG: MBL fold metallo-hydrolase, partial [Schlesneria sp.]